MSKETISQIMKEKIKNKLNDFFLSNQIVRAIKIFFHQKLRPLLLKIIAALVALLIIVIIILQIIKPDFLSKTYQKSSFYFHHYLNLDNQNFNKFKIKGNKRTSTRQILKIVKRIQSSSESRAVQDEYQPIIQKMTFEIKKQLPWIDTVLITRSIPNIINISVKEYVPFAIWYYKDKKYVADKRGNTIPIKDVKEFEDLIIISGAEANDHINSLFNVFTINPSLGSEVYSATWSGNRRWDIRLNSGLLIKLPENGIVNAWDSLIKIYNMKGATVGLKVMDLRISGKVYLKYGDSTIKEIKSL